MSVNLRKCMCEMHDYCCSKKISTKRLKLKKLSNDPKFFDALYEIVNNIARNNFKFKSWTQAQKKKGKKHIKIMNKIHRNPKNHIIRKKLVAQSGGFIQFILPVLATVVTELLSNAISKKSNPGDA